MALLTNPKNDTQWLSHFELVHDDIEASIKATMPSDESYIGHALSADALYTSFDDYFSMLTHPLIRQGDTFVDVGAGLGKGSLLAQSLELNVRVLSLELVRERHEAAKQAAKLRGLSTENFKCSDLMLESLPKARHYFLYLPTGILLSKILRELESYAKEFEFYVWSIESHGDLIATLKNLAPHLELHDHKIKLSSIRHDPSLYIFKSSTRDHYKSEAFPFQNLLVCNAKNVDAQVLIEDCDLGSMDKYHWIASLDGISLGVRPGYLQASYPAREFSIDKVRGVLPFPPADFGYWVRARKEGRRFACLGQVRKLITAPIPKIEFSDGARLELDDCPQSAW